MDNKYSNISKELFPSKMLEKFKNVDFSMIQPSYSVEQRIRIGSNSRLKF